MGRAVIGRRLLELDPAAPPAQAVALDDVLAMAVGAGRMPPTLRIWRCGPAVVAPRRCLRGPAHPGLAGWPLCGRSSGGEAVVLGPGVLCVSLILPLVKGTPALEQAYRAWLDGVCAGIQMACGVPVSSGRVPGAFCDGRYNAVVEGRKLGGTAQSRRHGSVVVHGCLLIDVDLAWYCRTLDVVAGRDCPAGAHGRHIAALRQVAGRAIDLRELADAMTGGFAATGLSSPGTGWGLPRPDELDGARALWPNTRSPDPAASREARPTGRRHDVAGVRGGSATPS
jgi:lipoate-protein ligase A